MVAKSVSRSFSVRAVSTSGAGRDLPLPKPFKGAILVSKPAGIRRMSDQNQCEGSTGRGRDENRGCVNLSANRAYRGATGRLFQRWLPDPARLCAKDLAA